jgi:hypothetical protein
MSLPNSFDFAQFGVLTIDCVLAILIKHITKCIKIPKNIEKYRNPFFTV